MCVTDVGAEEIVYFNKMSDLLVSGTTTDCEAEGASRVGLEVVTKESSHLMEKAQRNEEDPSECTWGEREFQGKTLTTQQAHSFNSAAV